MELAISSAPSPSTGSSRHRTILLPFALLFLHSEVKIAFSLEAFKSNHLENRITRLESQFLPAVKVGSDIDCTSGPMVPSDGPVLLEASHPIDPRHIIIRQTVNVVDPAVTVNLAEDVSIAGNTIAVRLDNVPLGDRVLSPSVDSQSPVSRSLEVAVPGDRASVG